MEAILDGTKISTEHEFHVQIARLFDCQEYYGNNLDALWDLLTTEIERPIKLVWNASEESRAKLGTKKFNTITKILEDVNKWDIEMNLSEQFDFELR